MRPAGEGSAAGGKPSLPEAILARMPSLSRIPTWAWKLALLAATAIWGASYLVSKDLLDTVAPSWLVGVRSLAAGVILGAILAPRIRALLISSSTGTSAATGTTGAPAPPDAPAAHSALRTLGAGAALGVLDFAAQLSQTAGLAATTPGISAFLTATYCVIVPFAAWALLRLRPRAAHLAAAAIALAGIWLVSVSSTGEHLSIGRGEALTLVAAFFYALHIVCVTSFSAKRDVLVMTVVQFLVEGLLGCFVGAASCAFTGEPSGLAAIDAEMLAQFAFLVLFCAIFCFGVQNLALTRVDPTQASLILSLESVFGVLFSVALFGEELTARLLVGFALIFCAIVASELAGKR